MGATKTNLADYSHYSSSHLIDAFERGPSRVRHVLEGLSEEELRIRARGGDTWSCQEIAMHLADSEIHGAIRIRKAWIESEASLPGFNESLWATKLNHQGAPAQQRESALQLFSALRVSTAPILKSASEEDLSMRAGIHTQFGRLTLRNLLELYADHGERHIQQILTIRQLIGRPLELELLLRDRLY